MTMKLLRHSDCENVNGNGFNGIYGLTPQTLLLTESVQRLLGTDFPDWVTIVNCSEDGVSTARAGFLASYKDILFAYGTDRLTTILHPSYALLSNKNPQRCHLRLLHPTPR